MAFLPIATAAATLITGGSLTVQNLVFSAFGLVVTVGLATYNYRNDQLYGELVSRAALIERMVDLPDGTFCHRPRPWLTIRMLGMKFKVDHGTGIGLLYASSAVLWLFGFLAPTLEFLRRAYLNFGLPYLMVKDPLSWVRIAAFALSVLLVALAIRSIKSQREIRKGQMRKQAHLAVQSYLSDERNDEDLLRACRLLVDASTQDDVDDIKARIKFYSARDKETNDFIQPGSKEHVASQVIALITDLSPAWIFDCATERRKSIGKASR